MALEPQYHQLAMSDRRIQYGLVDLGNPQNRQIINMSRNTKTPISHTPHIVFYSGGQPFAKFTGKYNISSIQSFIGKVTSRLPPPDANQFSNPQYHRQPTGVGMYEGGMGSMTGPTSSGHQSHGGGKLYQPEIGSAPSMNGILKGGGGDHYSQVNNSEIEDDEEIQMMIPPDVTPYTKPWESVYRKEGHY